MCVGRYADTSLFCTWAVLVRVRFFLSFFLLFSQNDTTEKAAMNSNRMWCHSRE